MRTLYRRRADGRIAVQAFELNGASSRIHQGLVGSTLRPSKWKEFSAAGNTSAEGVARRKCKNMIRHMVQNLGWSESLESLGVEAPFRPMRPIPWSPHKMRRFRFPVHVQPFVDGVRVFVSAERTVNELGAKIHRMRNIDRVLQGIFALCPDLILDGVLRGVPEEILTAKDLSAEEEIQAEKDLVLHVFDCAEGAGMAPFNLRFGFFAPLIRELDILGHPVKLVEALPATCLSDVDSYSQQLLVDSWEGVVVRISYPGSHYKEGPSDAILVRKEYYQRDFHVVKLYEGRGHYVGHALYALLKTSNLEGRFKAPIAGSRADKREAWESRKILEGGTATVKFGKIRDSGGEPQQPVIVELKAHEWKA